MRRSESDARPRGRMWILYDDRAAGGLGDTDDASVLVACADEREARGYAGLFGGMAAYSYEVARPRRARDDGELVDERWEWDWTPEGGFSDKSKAMKQQLRRSNTA